jgi:glycerol-3-phosphate O-acyltransferase/dihydroxyacetone phosphate acyltransferase
MALGAMANDPTCLVKIVPVGLAYFHAHKFRSRAVVEFGAAIDVPMELVDMFKEGGAKKRDAVSKFLDLIYDGLKTVTVRAPDYDTLMVRPALSVDLDDANPRHGCSWSKLFVVCTRPLVNT